MILCWLLFVPFIGGFLCWQIERRGAPSQLPRWVALLTMLLVVVLSLWLWLTGDFSLTGAIGDSRAGPASSASAGSTDSAFRSISRSTACR